MLEVGVGFAGEADDDVGGDGDFAFSVFHPVDAAHVFVAGVEALHAVENGSGAALNRQVDVVTEGRIFVDGIDDVFDKIAGVGGGEPDALEAIDFAHAAQEHGEIKAHVRGVFVTVDVLTEEGHLTVAVKGELAGFFKDAGTGSAALWTARHGNDAVGTAFVATFDDGEEGFVAVIAAGVGDFEGLVGIEAQACDAAITSFELDEHLGELVVAGRAGDEANVGGAFKDLFTFLLGDATDDCKDLIFTFFLEFVQAGKDLLLGFVTDAAGVVDDEIGFFRGWNLLVAFTDEGADDLLGIVDVHLATKGFDVKVLHAGTKFYYRDCTDCDLLPIALRRHVCGTLA